MTVIWFLDFGETTFTNFVINYRFCCETLLIDCDYRMLEGDE